MHLFFKACDRVMEHLEISQTRPEKMIPQINPQYNLSHILFSDLGGKCRYGIRAKMFFICT